MRRKFTLSAINVKNSLLVSNSAHMVLHGDAQTFNRRNKKKNLNVLLLESEYFYTFVSLL